MELSDKVRKSIIGLGLTVGIGGAVYTAYPIFDHEFNKTSKFESDDKTKIFVMDLCFESEHQKLNYNLFYFVGFLGITATVGAYAVNSTMQRAPEN